MEDLGALLQQRFGEAWDGPVDDPAAAALAPLVGRRSRRRFRAEPVAPALLELLFAAMASTPTKSDLQQFSVIHLADPAVRGRVDALLAVEKDAWIATAPVFLLFCADLRRARRICALKGRPHRNDNMDSFVNATVDAALALRSFIAAAESAGLGCVPLSVVRNHIDAISDIAGLPAGVYPVAGLVAGWPDGKAYVSMRLPVRVFVHRDRYDDAALAAELDGYDARRDAVAPIGPGKQRYPEVHGIDPVCRWSDNAARQVSVPERPAFREFLRKRGFALD